MDGGKGNRFPLVRKAFLMEYADSERLAELWQG